MSDSDKLSEIKHKLKELSSEELRRLESAIIAELNSRALFKKTWLKRLLSK